MAFNVTTTGSNVTLSDLGVTLTHPQTIDLLGEGLGYSDIIDSIELNTALANGTLNAADENGTPIPSVTLGGVFQEIIDATAPTPMFFEQVIWGEENGPIAANQTEYSYGNGATGLNTGIPSPWNCEAVGMVLNAETFGASATVELLVNSSSVSRNITGTSRDTVTYFGTPLAITQGQRLNFRTTAVSGTWQDVRVGVILRIPIITS